MTGTRRVLFLLSLAAATALWAGLADPASATERKTNIHGIDPANIDAGCSPCADFDRYANGGWKDRNSIPGEYPFWGTSLEVLERNNVILREILEDAAANPGPKGTVAQKIGDFYYSALDSARAERDDISPLRPDLERMAGIADVDDLVAAICDYRGRGKSFLFGIEAMQDLADSEMVILYVSSGGLGLPERDYYLREDEESAELRARYVDYMAKMFRLVGDDEAAAAARARAVMAIETRLAGVTLTAVEQRDPANLYNVVTVAEAGELMPRFDWPRYLDAAGLPGLASFSLTPPKFFVELDAMFAEIPIEDWRSYMRLRTFSGAAPYLSTRFADASFDFYGRVLSGQAEQQPRWKRANQSVGATMGEALGQLFVERNFPPEAKARALEMVGNLKAALREKIEGLEWMGPETKVRALEKLESFGAKIGYPDAWRDYSDLEIERGSWFENLRRAQLFAQRYEMSKIGNPPDRGEWVTNPHTVNAFYNPLMNDITFPAGILQPPMFDVAIDDAVNYGCMGVVIGHEMIHGFDDSGRRFDPRGNMTDWWTEQDSAKFLELAERMVKQFDAYVAIDSLHVNGRLTLGENIGDRGGLRIAYRALQMARAGKPDPMIDGFTQEQRFFLSFAQFFRSLYTPEFLKLIVNSDPHTPNMYRVIGPLSHMTEFAEAFGCKRGDRMYTPPEEQVHVW